MPIDTASGGTVREALEAWTASAGSAPTFADDLGLRVKTFDV